jgi:uncharacterized membrane protein YgcG
MKFLQGVFFLGFTLSCVFAFSGTVHAVSITSFDARIVVHENATIEVTEQIVYNFGEDVRHGIFRKIPYSYQAKTETYTADVISVLVTNEFGEPLLFNESKENGELTIKIGDPEVTITGTHTYIISYIVQGPFLYFNEFDEFYWNVTGFWEQPILKASALVDLPRGVQIVSAACYKGGDGSKNPCDKDERLLNNERAGYNAVAENLSIMEGLTVAVAFPKNVIAESKKPWEKDTGFSPYMFLPFVISLLMILYMLKLWSEKGRDPKGRSTIVTEFSPPENVVPSLAGVVLHESVKGKEISAEIVRLAVEGYLKIHRFDKKVLLFSTTDYLLERIGSEVPKDTLGVLILEKLFQDVFFGEEEISGAMKKGVLVSKMAHKFVEEKKQIDESIYKSVVMQKLFVNRPDKVRLKYILGGGLVSSVGVLGAVFVFINYSDQSSLSWLLLFGPTALSVGAVVFLGNFMPVKTQEGVRVKEHLLGFKRYLEVAEKDRIDFHSSPDKESGESEKTINLFDKYLPYAMVFGVEEKWAEKFEEIYLEEPKWYSGGAGHVFTAGAFASDLSGFASQVSTATAPQSSGSSGGGSSGGGFGGGGGGSW